MICSACQAAAPADAKFCSRCGGRLLGTDGAAPDWAPCRSCQQPVERDARFCTHCGKPSHGCYVCGAPGEPLCETCTASHTVCRVCGQVNPHGRPACSRCRGMLNLPTDFFLHPNEYEFAADRDGMNALRAMKPVNMAADYVARKLGKPFIESQFIGGAIRVSDEQFPNVYRLAGLAAKVLCLPQMPQIYVSGDKGWLSETYGTTDDSFVVLGSFLLRQLSEFELLFVIGQVFGHIKSGHAMYRTVANILGGTQSENIMSKGLFGLLDVGRLVSLPIELPLLSWIRQSEVTADAAGLLLIGDVHVARRVLIALALRNADMVRQINHDAYLRQQEELDSNVVKLSEYMSQNTPYIARRIKLMSVYASSSNFAETRRRIQASGDLQPVMAAIEALRPRPAQVPSGDSPPGDAADVLRGRCPHCNTGWSVARAKIPAEGEVALRCSQCHETFPVANR